MVIWAVLGGLVAAVGALAGYAIWRDRRRSSGGDRAVSGAAAGAAERRNAEREAVQGANRQRDQIGGP